MADGMRPSVSWSMEIWKATWDRCLLHCSRLEGSRCFVFCNLLKRFKDDALATLARMAMSDGLAHSDIFAVAHSRT